MLCVYKDKWPLYPEKIKTSNDNGEDKTPSPTSPELTRHLRQSLQSTGQGPCIWPIQDEGQVIRPIRSRDKKSNRSYTKGQVPVFTGHRNQAATYKKNKIHFRHNFFIIFSFVLF